jgi:competence protein ComGC
VIKVLIIMSVSLLMLQNVPNVTDNFTTSTTERTSIPSTGSKSWLRFEMGKLAEYCTSGITVL